MIAAVNTEIVGTGVVPLAADDDRKTRFTLIFKGDIRDLKFNPLFEQTVFGECCGMGVGDAFAENERLQEEIDALRVECAG